MNNLKLKFNTGLIDLYSVSNRYKKYQNKNIFQPTDPNFFTEVTGSTHYFFKALQSWIYWMMLNCNPNNLNRTIYSDLRTWNLICSFDDILTLKKLFAEIIGEHRKKAHQECEQQKLPNTWADLYELWNCNANKTNFNQHNWLRYYSGSGGPWFKSEVGANILIDSTQAETSRGWKPFEPSLFILQSHYSASSVRWALTIW